MSAVAHVFGTSNQSNYLNMLVENYKAFSKGSSENILGLAETVRQAEEELSEKNCKEFFSRIGLDADSSTVRKLRKIAECGTRFQPVVDQIPNNWTTLYALAKLPEEHFGELVQHKILHPFVTMKAITTALNQLHPSEKKPRKVSGRFTVDLSTIDDPEERDRIQTEIRNILIAHGVVSADASVDEPEADNMAPASPLQQPVGNGQPTRSKKAAKRQALDGQRSA